MPPDRENGPTVRQRTKGAKAAAGMRRILWQTVELDSFGFSAYRKTIDRIWMVGGHASQRSWSSAVVMECRLPGLLLTPCRPNDTVLKYPYNHISLGFDAPEYCRIKRVL